MIKVEHLSQSFREQQVLENISFEIKQGEFFGIIGPNGSGKSTLLRLISGIDPVKNGNVHLDGQVTYLPIHEKSWLDGLLFFSRMRCRQLALRFVKSWKWAAILFRIGLVRIRLMRKV